MATPSEAARHDVLIVEDDVDCGEALANALEQHGYRVAVATSAPEALTFLSARLSERLNDGSNEEGHLPRVILVDLVMPGMGGEELLRAVRAVPALAAIPIVIVSGVTDVERRAERLAVEGYLRKPPSFEDLIEMSARFAGPPHASAKDD